MEVAELQAGNIEQDTAETVVNRIGNQCIGSKFEKN